MAKFTNQNRKTITGKNRKPTNKRGKSRTNPKSRNEDGSITNDENVRNAGNDPMWYAANAQMLTDVASYSFFNPLGRKIDGLDPQAGIFTCNWIPAFGESNSDENSALNVASRLFYSWVRHANSGHANYEAPDLMMYIMAMDSIYSFHAALVRIYGLMKTYSYTNKYIPRNLVMALGFDYDDILANLASFRYFINATAVKMSSMAVPATFTYYQRHIWMNSNVYLDEASMKGQIYAFHQTGFFKFSPRTSTRGSELTLHYDNEYAPNTLINFDTAITIMNDLLDAVLSDEDCNIMSGDILKAYGSSNIMQFGPIPEDYAIIPVVNPEVLLQIHNAVGIGILDTYQVQQNNGIIAVTMEQASAHVLHERNSWKYLYMDAFTDSPTPAEVMVGSRLIARPYYNTGNVVTSVLCCSEIVTNFSIGVLTDAGAYEQTGFPSIASFDSSSYDFMSLTLKPLLRISQFNRAPFICFTDIETGFTSEWIGNTNNVTTLDRNELAKLHDTALLSMLDVTHVAYKGATAK